MACQSCHEITGNLKSVQTGAETIQAWCDVCELLNTTICAVCDHIISREWAYEISHDRAEFSICPTDLVSWAVLSVYSSSNTTKEG